MRTSLIVDKEGFFTGSYHRIFDPKNLELSYESANLVLEDIDSAFDEVVEKHNRILARRQRTTPFERRPQKRVEDSISAPSQEAFSEACDNYIHRSPSRYSCSLRRSGVHASSRQAFTLSEVSDSTQQDISDQFSSFSVSNFSTSTETTHSVTHQLASFAVTRSEGTFHDDVHKSILSKSAYKAPLSISATRYSKHTPGDLSTPLLSSARQGCLQLLSSRGTTSSNQIIVQSAKNPTSPLKKLPSARGSYLTLSRAGSKPRTVETPGKPSLTITVKTWKPP